VQCHRWWVEPVVGQTIHHMQLRLQDSCRYMRTRRATSRGQPETGQAKLAAQMQTHDTPVSAAGQGPDRDLATHKLSTSTEVSSLRGAPSMGRSSGSSTAVSGAAARATRICLLQLVPLRRCCSLQVWMRRLLRCKRCVSIGRWDAAQVGHSKKKR
jgi:hypothetical protein